MTDPAPSRPGLAVVFLLFWAAALWGIGSLIAGREPLVVVESFENWFAFGRRILGDVLRAASVLSLSVAVSAFVPRLGLWVERIVVRSPLPLFLGVTVGLAVCTSGLLSYFVFEHFPFIQDEIAMLFQAKLLTSGRLYAQSPELVDFFDYEFIVADGPRWYGKYFLGQSVLFALGVLLGAPWVINPLLAGLAVGLTYGVGRALLTEKLARIAAVLMVISPFRVCVFALMMAHPACMASVLLFAWGWARVMRDPARFGSACAAGVGAGFAFNTRPLTAVAMVGAFMLASLFALPWRRVRWTSVLCFLVPLILFAVVFLEYNHALTGDRFHTPFEKWSTTDRLGFGEDIGLEYWPSDARGHSLRKALLRNGYYNLESLGRNLIGWGHVSLALLFWPMIRSPWPKRTRPIAAAAVALPFAYLFYHHADPAPAVQARYWSEAIPMMLLLAAVALFQLRRPLGSVCRWLDLRPADRTGRAACWLAAALLTLWSLPTTHRSLILQTNLNFWGQGHETRIRDRAAKENLHNALVFVEATHYRNFKKTLRPDLYAYAFALNSPDLNGPVVYARDLGKRNHELIAAYPDRDVYRFVPGSTRDEDRFVPISPQAPTP